METQLSKALTEEGIKAAAGVLKCDIAAIKAVAEVESSGSGFLKDGRVKILFEGHIFHRYTKGQFDRVVPTLSFPKWTRQFYAKGPTAEARGAGEWQRLTKASELDLKAALMSASYGRFQIMGFNFPHCGFAEVQDFFRAMKESEDAQLEAFCNYLVDVGLDDELRQHRWADFARKYNGPEYKKNQYDKKLASAWVKHLE